jgi:hypothetical protein
VVQVNQQFVLIASTHVEAFFAMALTHFSYHRVIQIQTAVQQNHFIADTLKFPSW